MADDPVGTRPEVLLFPFSTPPAEDAEAELARLRAEEPVARVRVAGGGEAWLATRYDDVRLVLSDPRFSRARATVPGTPSVVPNAQSPDNIVNMDPPDHTRLRKLLNRAFTSRTVDRIRPQIAAIADGLLDPVAAAGPPADLVRDLARPLSAWVMCDIFGIPFEERARLTEGVTMLMAAAELPPEVVGATYQQVTAYLAELFDRKRAAPAPDLLTALVEVRDGDDRLTDSELVENTLGIYAAGQDTTSNQLTNSLVTLFRHPDQLALLIAEPERIPGAVEELLRYVRFAAGQLTRVATEDVELGAVTIRAGDAVLVANHSANRDGAVYEHPDELRLDRPNAGTHLTFGHGIHHCLGAALARTELQVALGSLLTRFPTIQPAVPLEKLEWTTGHSIRGLCALPVTW
jgi:cytochrome P450